MLYRPSSLVMPGKVTFVSTFVASTFTPAMTAPLVSVTRPVSVAVGPARREFVTSMLAKHISNCKLERKGAIAVLPKIANLPEYAARMVSLYQSPHHLDFPGGFRLRKVRCTNG